MGRGRARHGRVCHGGTTVAIGRWKAANHGSSAVAAPGSATGTDHSRGSRRRPISVASSALDGSQAIGPSHSRLHGVNQDLTAFYDAGTGVSGGSGEPGVVASHAASKLPSTTARKQLRWSTICPLFRVTFGR